MNAHENARMTPAGRELLAQRIEGGWIVMRAATAAGISTRTAAKWLARHRLGGERRHYDRSSAPKQCPHAIPPERIARIEALRRQRMTGAQIAIQLCMARSTVGAILRLLGLGRLGALEPKPPVQRYEYDAPGGMIHIEMKKLGRFEEIGHRITGDRTNQSKTRRAGWEVLHVVGERLWIVMSSIMRRRSGLNSAVWKLLSEGWAPTPTSSQTRGSSRELAASAAVAASFNQKGGGNPFRFFQTGNRSSTALRWTAAGMMEAAKRFRRLKSRDQLPTLRDALQRHHENDFGLDETSKAA